MLSSVRVRLGLRAVSCPLSSNSAVREEQGERPVQEMRAPVALPCGCSMGEAVLESVFHYVDLLLSYHAAAAHWIPLSVGWWCSRVGVQQQLQFKEESKHTAYYWKYSRLTVQHIGLILWIFWLTKMLELVLLFSKILRQLYACVLLLSVKGYQIIQIILK